MTLTLKRASPTMPSERSPSRPGPRWDLVDVLGLAFVVVAGVVVLVPALAHGASLGPYDILRSSGLTRVSNVEVHNTTLVDQIRLFIPWTNLVWTQVHQGHLPLWNPYSALGMPLSFNWESASLSLPVLVGYLFPLRLAYTAQLIVAVLTAGTGAYVLGKVLRLGTLAATTAGVVFELSGPFIGLLGWPLSSVMSWAGWLFAGVVLVLRGGTRARSIALLAVVVAFAIYAGDPEGLLLLGISAGIFASIMLLLRLPMLGGSGPVLRPAADLGLSAMLGAALAAPLILPGLQLARGSNRITVGAALFPKGLPPKEMLHLVFQGFDGLPLAHSQWFGISAYQATSLYIGVIALVLAGTAVSLRWARPEVRSLTAVAVAMALILFVPPLVTVLDSSIARIYWIFAMTPLAFCLAVLAGIGMDALVNGGDRARVGRALVIGFAAMAVLLVGTWLVGRRGLTPSQSSIRSHSFVWPAIAVAVGLVVVFALARRPRRAHSRGGQAAGIAGAVGGVLLLVVETAFLVTAGAPLMSSTSHYPTADPNVSVLKRLVGDGVVGLGTFPSISNGGILTNANLLYGVQEFAAYDPMLPHAYFSLRDAQGSAFADYADIFSPVIATSQAARLYGLGYLLEPSGFPGPTGTVFVRRIDDEDLYRVPGAAVATAVPLLPGGRLPDKYAVGEPVGVARPSPNTWRMLTKTSSPNGSVLRLRLSNVPGWHATIDGKPASLDQFAGVMMQLRVPPGRHLVELRYWPDTFTAGIVLAACGLIGIVLVLALPRIRRRTAGSHPAGSISAT